MWVILAIASALLLGCYDIFKKISVASNNVLAVLFWNTFFCALLLSPFIVLDFIHGHPVFGGDTSAHLWILLKSAIVLASWTLGYFSIKHLPLTISGPISATRPVIVLVGALLIFSESLNMLQSCGVALGFFSLFFISRLGKKESATPRASMWLWMAVGATVFGAISALYDKYLLRIYEPLQVQAWYSFYQCIIMGAAIAVIRRFYAPARNVPFRWKWTIPCIALFLSAADMAYFYALSDGSSMISVVSMIRRGSVLVSFTFGILALHEKHLKAKLIDLAVLLIGLVLLVLGSR